MQGSQALSLKVLGGLVALSLTATLQASETKTYTYDALGRLVLVKSTDDVNNNQAYSYCYDKAGNRIRYVANQTGTPANCVNTG